MSAVREFLGDVLPFFGILVIFLVFLHHSSFLTQSDWPLERLLSSPIRPQGMKLYTRYLDTEDAGGPRYPGGSAFSVCAADLCSPLSSKWVSSRNICMCMVMYACVNFFFFRFVMGQCQHGLWCVPPMHPLSILWNSSMCTGWHRGPDFVFPSHAVILPLRHIRRKSLHRRVVACGVVGTLFPGAVCPLRISRPVVLLYW